jgi:hypothetical protein
MLRAVDQKELHASSHFWSFPSECGEGCGGGGLVGSGLTCEWEFHQSPQLRLFCRALRQAGVPGGFGKSQAGER